MSTQRRTRREKPKVVVDHNGRISSRPDPLSDEEDDFNRWMESVAAETLDSDEEVSPEDLSNR